MAARGRLSSNSISLNKVLRVAVSLLVALGFLLYLSVFISPALLNKMMLAIDPCNKDDAHFGQQHHGMHSATAELSNAMDAAGHYHDDMKGEHSRLDYIEFEDSKTEKNAKDSNHQIILQEGRTQGERTDDRAKFTILVGVMTMASKIDRRSLLRLAYSVQSSQDARISVRFIIGGLGGDGGGVDRTLVGMENATFGDIVLLNCSENLNEGKTFTFFSSLPDRGLQYDYVMKTDDDSYIRFENLGRSLKPLSRTDLYYGYILPCENEDPYAWYMAGMGYLISWDLVLWIRESPIARNKSVGTEDQLVGDWFNEGGVAKHRVNEKPLFYDHPEFGGQCSHDLVPETILVHQVKTLERWAHVLDFFERDRISRALSLS